MKERYAFRFALNWDCLWTIRTLIIRSLEHPDEPGKPFEPVAAQQTVANLVRSGRKQR